MSAPTDAPFNWGKLLNKFNEYASSVDAYISSIGNMPASQVNMGTMFQLQMDMNQLSMFAETFSNVMAGVNAIGMTVSRNVKTS
ncbi:MAG: DUF5407 family protein [Parachlamydiales bacterium]|nr:DUF5407 family protein [Parachlamydiales bacterium]